MSALPRRSESAESILGSVAREVLTSLEGVLTRAAIGAARTAVRLGGIARRQEAIEGSAREVETVTARLRESIAGAAKAATDTADASRRVATITREGRDVSAQSMTSMRSLLDHSDQTNERLRSLLLKVREVTGVSRLIEEIASRTRFLALNASIEAQRAGAAGRAFGVVAGEVRDLAKSTAEKTQKIDDLMRGILADLEPARAAMEESRALVGSTAKSVEAVDQRLAVVNELAELTSGHVESIAKTLMDESGSMATLASAAQSVVVSLAEIRGEAQGIADAAFRIATATGEGHQQLARVDVDTLFHRGLGLCRELGERTGKLLDEIVDGGRCSLDQVLKLDYREIAGADVASLARLFDVSRVPQTGFTPPKFHTAYDALVDVKLQGVCDDVLGHERRLLFALAIDLNSYGPTHNRRFMQAWTGVAEKDLAGNRVKRFFTDNSVLVRGARVGLGPKAAALGHRASRADFERVGCDLAASAKQRDAFLVQTYARDTGALVTVVTVPVFVRGKRWGAALVGWSED